MKFGDKLKQQRTAAGLTQEQLSAQIGVTSRTLQNYESGAVYPKKRALYNKLAEHFQTDVNYWLAETQELPQQKSGTPYNTMLALTTQISNLFREGDLSEEELDVFMRLLQNAYWDAKDRLKQCKEEALTHE